jgi:hypothetical protein
MIDLAGNFRNSIGDARRLRTVLEDLDPVEAVRARQEE